MAAEEEQVPETAVTLADLVALSEGLSGREDFDAKLRVQALDDGFVELAGDVGLVDWRSPRELPERNALARRVAVFTS